MQKKYNLYIIYKIELSGWNIDLSNSSGFDKLIFGLTIVQEENLND